jgi:hypothetical protein
MTVPQAQQFVGRWRRVFIPWPSPLTGTGAARALEQSFLGIAIGPLPPLFISGAFSHWPSSKLIPLAAVMLISGWLSLRFRAAHRLLQKADAQHLLDLRSHLYDKPSA